MMDSLAKKLVVLASISLLVSLILAASLYKIFRFQTLAEQELLYLSQVQISLDQLRSQLWAFSQYRDSFSLREVEISQDQLRLLLAKSTIPNDAIKSVQKMNQSLASLLAQDKTFYKHADAVNSRPDQTLMLMQSRYSMLIQTMTEEVARVHHACLIKNQERLNQTVIYSATGLFLFTIVVCAVATILIYRFHKGLLSVRQGLEELSKGKFDSKIDEKYHDIELQELAGSFNEMTRSLSRSTVTKKELEQEIEKRTLELKLKQEQLQTLSETDPLTHLLNRRAFERSVESAIIRSNRTKLNFALLFIDIDKFKLINDRYGHDAGDAVLVETSQRLVEAVRQSDFVGRQGGDEFLVCFDLLSCSHQAIRTKAITLLETLCQPIHYNDLILTIEVSIGISYFPSSSRDLKQLINIADTAMYKAKTRQGAACYDNQLIALYKHSDKKARTR